MDHSHMDHGGMDHGHTGHGDMDMGNQCSMNMIFTWDYNNLCVIFRQWQITGTFSLLMSLVAIVVLTAGYECLRSASRRYDLSHEARMSAYSTSGSSEAAQEAAAGSWLIVGRDSKMTAERSGKIVKGIFYALQVFYSFFIMLLFMTYNGWIMLAVAVGAFVGYIGFSSDMPPTKSVACH